MSIRDRLPSLPRGRAFRTILWATIISQLGDWSGRLAAALLVAERTGSPLAVGAVGLVFAVPHVGLGQLSTATLERFGRRSVLVGCDTLRAVAFLALATLPLNTVSFLVVLAAAAMADPPFEANASAAIVELTSTDELDEAIRARQLTRQTTTMVGFGLAGLAAAWTSVEVVLALDALTFAISALLIRTIDDDMTGHVSGTARADKVLREGFSFLMSDHVSRRAVGATLVVVIAGMAIEGQVAVIGPALAGAGPSAIGLMAMAAPAGTLVAVALQGRQTGDEGMWQPTVVSVVAAAVAIALLQVSSSPAPLVVAFFAVGVIYQLSVAANVVVALRVPAERRATTFGLVQGAVAAAHGVGAWIGGVAIEVLGATRGCQLMLCLTGLLLVILPRPRATSHSQTMP